MRNPGKDCDVSLRPLRSAPRPSACWPPSDRARGAARVGHGDTFRSRSPYSQGLALWLTLNLPPLPTPGPSQRAPGLQLSPRLPPFGAPPPPLPLTSGSARLPRSPRPTEGPQHPPAGGLCASLPRATLPRLGASQRGAPGALQPEATLARHQFTSLCAGVQGLARPRPRCALLRPHPGTYTRVPVIGSTPFLAGVGPRSPLLWSKPEVLGSLLEQFWT